jgi:hypothetical protein
MSWGAAADSAACAFIADSMWITCHLGATGWPFFATVTFLDFRARIFAETDRGPLAFHLEAGIQTLGIYLLSSSFELLFNGHTTSEYELHG